MWTRPTRGRPRHDRRTVRLVGWVLAINAMTLLAAVTLGESAREATARFALWCGLG